MKRRLRDGEAVIKLNELVYRGGIVRALMNHSADRLQVIKVIIEVDSIGTVDKDGNVLMVNNDGHEWVSYSKDEDPWIEMDDSI